MKTPSIFEAFCPLQVITCIIITVLAQGDAQSFSCNDSLSKPLCPGDVTWCACVVTGTISFTRWNFTNLDVCNSSNNIISLPQPCNPTETKDINGSCGPYLSAVNKPSGPNLCNTSILTITADISLNGLIIECRDLNVSSYPGALVGSVTVTIATAPRPVAKINGTVGADWLNVIWTPPTTIPLMYNVSYRNGSHTSSPVVIADNGSSEYAHNFTGLVSNTLYTVSVVAINCAGSSNAELSKRTYGAIELASVVGVVGVVGVLLAVVIVIALWNGKCKKNTCFADGEDEAKKKKQ